MKWLACNPRCLSFFRLPTDSDIVPRSHAQRSKNHYIHTCTLSSGADVEGNRQNCYDLVVKSQRGRRTVIIDRIYEIDTVHDVLLILAVYDS